MKKKFKIDEIYREKLGGIETPPPADSWDNILTGLPEKNKNRIAPLWYRIGTIAAVIAILVILFNDLIVTPQSSTIPITVGKERELFNPDPTSENFEKYMREAGASLESIIAGSKNSPGRYQEGRSSVTDSGLANAPKEESKKLTVTGVSPSSAKNKTQVVTRISSPIKQNVTPNLERDSREDIISGVHFTFQPMVLAELEFTTPNLLAKISPPTLFQIPENTEKSGGEELAENAFSVNKFSLITSAGVVYLGTIGNGNLLASQFSDLEDGSRVTASYGIHLAYRLSPNLKIRSGVSKVDFSYNTQNINYMAVLNSQAVTGPLTLSTESIETSVAGTLNHGFGFMEVPLELEYALINKNFEINLIGGLSSFFLQENNISFNDGANTADLGEARNLKDLSFSANVGVGLNYYLSRQIQFNLEPIFKYSINTFDRSSNVQSYHLGVHSGLRFNF